MPADTLTRRSFLWSGLLTAAATLGIPQPVAAGMRAGDRPKPVTLPDLAGTPIALPEAYAGKVVAIHFWATWCPYCLKEIDALEALVGQYRARGFAPVSVNVGETRAVVAASLGTRQVTYPILLDADSAAAKQYGVTGIPTTFVLDRGGAIAFKILGEINRDGLRRILSGVLGA